LIGSVLFKVRTAAPEDILINLSMTDVRCAKLTPRAQKSR
jgi:hypothetical protein